MNRRFYGIGIYLLLVFLSGVAVGAVGYHFYRTNVAGAASTPSRRSPEEFRRNFVKLLKEKLQLSPEQVSELVVILDESGAKFRQARAKFRAESETIERAQVERILAILKPDQQRVYRSMLEEWEKKRRAREQQTNRSR